MSNIDIKTHLYACRINLKIFFYPFHRSVIMKIIASVFFIIGQLIKVLTVRKNVNICLSLLVMEVHCQNFPSFFFGTKCERRHFSSAGVKPLYLIFMKMGLRWEDQSTLKRKRNWVYNTSIWQS